VHLSAAPDGARTDSREAGVATERDVSGEGVGPGRAGEGDGALRGAGRRSSSDRVFGIVSVVALVLAAVFGVRMLRGGAEDTGGVRTGPVPALAIVQPTSGSTVASPVGVVLATAAPLRPGPMGWQADGRHLHLVAGDAELMAGTADLVPAGPGRWRWTVQLPPGERTLRLYWSGADHVRMEAGASPAVLVRVR
jgi:hypothetical protein